MKGRLIAVLGCATSLVTTALASGYTIIHLRSYSLANLFDGTANGIGSNISDVAFDGTNLYVAGYHTGSGLQTVGMARISNFYDGSNFLPSNSTLTEAWKVQLQQEGGSRDTRLVYYNGSLYLGTGLGSGTAANTGIRKYDTNGNLDTSWAGDGVLSLSEAGVSRYDTLEIDPGSGGGASLAVGVFGSTIIRRFDLNTGANVGNTGAVSGAPTAVRDITFAPNGDMFYKWNGGTGNAAGVRRFTRTGATTFTDAGDFVTFTEGALQQSTVAYVPVSQAYGHLLDVILYNQRVSGTNQVFVRDVAGNLIATLTGVGPTADNFTPPSGYANTLLNYSHYITSDGRLFIFVVQGGGATGTYIDRLDIYEVVPEPGSLLALGAGTALLGLIRRRRQS